MANHVTNRVTFTGNETEVVKMLSEIKGKEEDSFIDFNTFCPIPKELEGTVSPVKIISQKEYAEQEKKIANGELTEQQKQWGLSRGITKKLSAEYQKKFGADNWYDWQCANWGTKWNAYDQYSNGDNMIEFHTAWSTPYNAMVNLSNKYPTIEIFVEYADEDFGYNVGKYTILNGVVINEETPEGGSQEALLIAMDINGNEEYYLTDYLCDNACDKEEEELNEYALTLVQIAHDKAYLVDEYPKPILNKLIELALADEQYERVKIITDLLNK